MNQFVFPLSWRVSYEVLSRCPVGEQFTKWMQVVKGHLLKYTHAICSHRNTIIAS